MPDITHAPLLPFKALGFKHRVGEPKFKYLFQGHPTIPSPFSLSSSSPIQIPNPNNYLFALALQTSFYSPVHKHNFEQFRYAHSGSFSIGPNLTINEGELCYHPEGVEYGPQLDEEDGTDHILLILQFGGVSGQGYLPYDQLLKVQKELSEKGRFEGGKYFPALEGEEKGEGEGIDGFQATWEMINKRELVYPEPKYAAPVLMKAGNFEWVRDQEQKGIWKKPLGFFTERETRAEMLRLEGGGAWEASAVRNALQLVFVTNGSGSLGGENLEIESAVRLVPGEVGTFSSSEGMEMLRLVIPQVELTQ